MFDVSEIAKDALRGFTIVGPIAAAIGLGVWAFGPPAFILAVGASALFFFCALVGAALY